MSFNGFLFFVCVGVCVWGGADTPSVRCPHFLRNCSGSCNEKKKKKKANLWKAIDRISSWLHLK